MATSTKTNKVSQLKLINASTHSPLELVKSGPFKVGDDIIIGDMYSDGTNPSVSVIVIQRKMELLDSEAVISQLAKTKIGA